ncbi:MAG: hypothetical protein U0641_16935 [Anaerolineae bacterium]
MELDVRTLTRYQATPVAQPQRQSRPTLPPQPDVVIFAGGNSGEALGLRIQALGYEDGVHIRVCGLNNDMLAPRSVPVREPGGQVTELQLTERLVMNSENPRDLVNSDPLLARRYERLLRGVPVLETYMRAGPHGGHGHPTISALDIDLHIDEVIGFVRRGVLTLRTETAAKPGQSDWERVRQGLQERQQAKPEKRVLYLGGGAGSMGNAGHHLMPYLTRHLLAEHEIAPAEVWGVVLGPRAFTGLTPYIRANYRALLEALDHMTQHGQRREYANGLTIDMKRPPYDRLFLIDDPHLPSEKGRVTEAEVERFLDRTALSLYLLLRGDVWETVAAHTAQPNRAQALEDRRPRYLHTVNAVMAGVDRAYLADALTSRVADQMLEAFRQRLAA